MKQALYYSAVLIGVYLVTARATDAGRLIGAGASGYATGVRALQGR